MELENIPDQILVRILEAIQERIDDGEANLDEDPFHSTNMEMLENVCMYFGITLNDFVDKSFFIKLYKDNPNFQTEPLKKPTLETYDVVHEEGMMWFMKKTLEKLKLIIIIQELIVIIL